MSAANKFNDSSTSLKDQVLIYFRSWIWFLFSIFILVGTGYLYLRYATKLYRASASIIIKDTQSGGGLSEVEALGELDVLGSSFNTVENEIEILKSKRLLEKVVKDLDLNIEYERTGNVKTSNIYRNSPVIISILNDSVAYSISKSTEFVIHPVTDSKIKIHVEDEEHDDWITVDYGAPFVINDIEMLALPNLSLNKEKDSTNWEEVVVRAKPLMDVVRSYSSKIEVVKSDRRGSVVNMSITDPIRQKAEDILNGLVEKYNEDAIADKNQVAKNTADFIDERLYEVQRDLDSIEQGIQRFKNSKDLTDLTTESLINLEESSELGREAVMTQTKIQVANSILDRLSQSDYQIIPENVGLEDFNISSQTSKYNSILTEYKNLLNRGTSENPTVIRLKAELDGMKSAMKASIESLISRLNIQRNSIKDEIRQVSGKISKVPENERLNRDIERSRRVVEAIYVLLSERRETTAISLAITAPKAKIVDFAYAPKQPVAPKPIVILFASLLLGILIPFGFIYIRNLFYNKIENRKEVQSMLPNLAILGEIPKLDNSANGAIEKNDRSILAESFRILRTNLQFKLSALQDTITPLIMVTSTIKGEGKTFVAYNLAATLAYSGKRVLLIGGDIRNPQIHRYLDGYKKNETGVTEFLTQKDLKLNSIVHGVEGISNLDVVFSGGIPPNPAELWMLGRTEDLFQQAREQYDVVLVDTAPTMLVTDTLLINHMADVTVYVCRANYTDKQLLDYIYDQTQASKIKNPVMVLNSVKLTNFGYGNKYGYMYAADKEGLWNKLMRKLRPKKSNF